MQQKHDKYNTMIFGILTLITALAISAVAIYYSVAGLMAIFAAAALPIMIMGGTLEIAKLVTAVWLHKYWERATWWIKTYLVTAVVVLMFITSMGIFGFLSKAHIEQTSAGEESVAQVTQIESEIGRLNSIITRADEKIKALETSLTADIQVQTDKLVPLDDLVASYRDEEDTGFINRTDNRGEAERVLQEQKPERDAIAAEINRLRDSARPDL